MTSPPPSPNSSTRPGPAATITSLRPRRSARFSRARSICSAKWVTWIRRGAPARMPASTAAPTSSTCTWTFQRPSPPTTTRESPSGASSCRSDGMASSSASRRYITSYAGPPSVRSPDGMLATGMRRAADVGRARGGPLAGDRGLGGVQDHAQPAATGVDHAGLREQRQLLGGAGQGLPSGARRGPDDVAQPVVGVLRRLRPPLRRRPGRRSGWCPRPVSRPRRRRPRSPAPCPRRRRPPTGRPARPCRCRRSSAPTSWLRMTPELPRAPSRAPFA